MNSVCDAIDARSWGYYYCLVMKTNECTTYVNFDIDTILSRLS